MVQRGIIDDKMHCDGRLGYFLEGDGLRVFRRAERVADMDIRDAGDGHDGTDARFRYFYLI